MTLEEKVAQLYGVWVGAGHDGGEVAPHQHDMDDVVDLDALLPHGLGQLTRPFGTAPVDAGARRALAAAHPAADRRGEPPRHPGRRARGVPRRLRGLGRDGLPGAALLGRDVRPRARRADGRADRRRHALGRRAPGPRARARRRARRPLGPRRGDHRRGPVPRRRARHRVRARPRVGRHRLDPQALRRLLGLEGGPQPRPRVDRTARARRRAAAPVRDGDPRGRRPLGDERVHRHRRRARRPPTRSCSPGCCATPGASRAPSSPTTSRSPSSGCCTASPRDGATPRRSPCTAGIDVELPTVNTFGAPLLEAVARRPARRGRDRPRPAPRARAEARARHAGAATAWPSPRRSRAATSTIRSRCAAPSISTRPRTASLARELSDAAVVLLRNDGVLPARRPEAHRGDRPERRRPVRGARLLLVPGAHRRAVPRHARTGSTCRPCSTSVRAEFPDAAGRVRARHDRSTAARPTSSPPRSSPREARRRRRARARRPRRALRPRHERRGLRRRGPRPPGSAAGAARRAPGIRDPDDRDPALRSALRPGIGARRRPPRSCRRSSRARRARVSIAGVLSGRVNPSGRLPVSIPRSPGAQPSTYLAAPLGRAQLGVEHRPDGGLSRSAPGSATPRSSGRGLADRRDRGRHRRARSSCRCTCATRASGRASRSCSCTCTTRSPRSCGPCSGSSASPGCELEAGESARVSVRVPADLAAFTGAAGARIVEPGEIVLGFGRSSGDIPLTQAMTLTGRRSHGRSHPRRCTRASRWSRRLRPRRRAATAQAAAGGAVLCRTTRLVARSIRGTLSSGALLMRITSRVASSAIRFRGWWMVVSVGLTHLAIGMSS